MATSSIGPGTAFDHKVAICCITLRRPKMLRQLLDSWQNLIIPERVLPEFIVVENSPDGSCSKLVENMADDFSPYALVYEIASDPGIPAARNMAVEIALRNGADLILFVDDDEAVDVNWLTEMIATYRETGAALIGGPVFARFENKENGYLAELVKTGLKARYDRIARRAAKKLKHGKEDKISIDTNNWLADARLFTEYGMSFDNSLTMSGGSDTKLYNQVRDDKSLRTTWSPNAVVYETVHGERLTPGYQYYRGMQQSRNSIHHKLENHSRLSMFPIIIGNVLIRIVTITILALGLPFNPASNFVRILRSAGWISGRVTGFFGARSNLYEVMSQER